MTDPILQVIERSNQRGGRMLSVADLIEAGTLTRDQVAWLAARIESGRSWLVGARPGGAGKTAVMSALLGLLPAETPVRLTVSGSGWETAAPGDCLVSYEISPGYYDAYIWGDDIRRFAQLGADGCRIVSNLHADTLDEARDQIVNDNGVPERLFDAFEIFLPISVSGGFLSARRRVQTIRYCEDGEWRAVSGRRERTEREERIATFLDRCLDGGLRRVEEVRAAWLDWLGANPIN